MSWDQKYGCREKGDDDWTELAAINHETAAEHFAKSVDLGYDERQEMIVEVLLVGRPLGEAVSSTVRVDWNPVYFATEVPGGKR